jgi:lipopolysaccharide export system permease protein
MQLLPIIDGYIIKKFLKTFFFAVCIFSLISIFIDVSEKIDDFIKRKPSFLTIVFDYYIWFIPYIITLLCPVFVFLSALFFNSKMAQNTEIIAILNIGINYRRFLRPYFVACTILVIIFIFFTTFLVPHADRQRYLFEDKWIREKVQKQSDNINCQINDQTVLHMESFNYLDSIGVNISMERFENNRIKERVFATRLIWNKDLGKWTLENYQNRIFAGENEIMIKRPKVDTVLSIKPSEFIVKTQYISSMTNPELNEYIRQEREKGSALLNKYYVELYKRIAMPCSFYVVTLLAVAITSKKSRGGTGMHLGIGIFVTFFFLLITQIFNTLGFTNVMNPAIAVWLPNVIFLTGAIFVTVKAPK